VQSIIEFDKVSFSYGRNEVLKDVDLVVEKGDFFAIVGPNGGGKTTILRLILGLEPPDKGRVLIMGGEPSRSTLKTGYVPQFSNHDRVFPISVKDVVLQGLIRQDSFFPFYSAKDIEKSMKIMEFLGIKNRCSDRFGDLSGGLKQRTLIARAIVSDPEILLLDEPVASVDSSIEKDIYDMLIEFNRKMTIIMVSHDLGFVSQYVNKIGCVNRTFVCHRTEEMTAGIVDRMYNGKNVMINHKCGI
jgi:zinc transport system ATP-binding protein